jgi:DNA-binding PadR family transcriptional regulator
MYLKDIVKLNQTSYVILGLLSVEPHLSGYDMRKTIQSSIGFFWGESYGQLYPALKGLAGEGLIAPSKRGKEGRKQRQTYVITIAGRAALREWLALPFQNDPPRNEFLLKLFFGHEAAPGVTAAHIRDLNERNQQAVALLAKIEQSIPNNQFTSPHLPYWILALEMGKAFSEAALEWGEAALAALPKPGSPKIPTPQRAARLPSKPKNSSRKRLTHKPGSARP